jgi:hypothetical protein
VLKFAYRDFTNSLHLQKTEVPESRDHPSYFVYIHISWLHKFYFGTNKLLDFNEKDLRKQRKRDGESIYNDWMEPEFLNKLRRKKYTREMLKKRKRDEENYKWGKTIPVTGRGDPIDSQMAVRLSVLRAGPPLTPGRFLVLISVRG